MFVVVDVGCTECGEDTKIVAIRGTEEAAMDALRVEAGRVGIEKPEAIKRGYVGYFAGGQRCLQVLKCEGKE